jgi:hypothetical protein
MEDGPDLQQGVDFGFPSCEVIGDLVLGGLSDPRTFVYCVTHAWCGHQGDTINETSLRDRVRYNNLLWIALISDKRRLV